MSAHTKKCLNCNAPLHDDFCSHCGQAASTHRFSLKYVFKHDFLRSVFYFQGAFFYTLKELFTRPGHSVREYIQGKRVQHLNYFTLLIVMIILFSLVERLTPFHYADLVTGDNKEIMAKLDGILQKQPKYLFIGVIPWFALFSFLFFRKAKQNYAEHFVLNTFKASAVLVFNIVFIVMASFVKDLSVVKRIDAILLWITLGYAGWLYYQYFSVFYTNKFLLLLRTLLCVIIPSLMISLLAIFILAEWASRH